MAKCVNFSFILPIEKAFFSYNWEKDIGQSDVIGPSNRQKYSGQLLLSELQKRQTWVMVVALLVERLLTILEVHMQ